MLHANAERILASLAPTDVVVDVGGWAQPFARANYVIDLMPYDCFSLAARIRTKGSCTAHRLMAASKRGLWL